MSADPTRTPKLEAFYQQFLVDENSATFIESVASNYMVGTLERLARYGQRISRRAAVMAIGYLGDFSSNEIMGAALVDSDRGVRLLADHGIRDIWQRQGSVADQNGVRELHRLVGQSKMAEAIDSASELIRGNPDLGEAWNQRAVAYCHEGFYEAAIEDCRETLNCNRFHFPAAMGIGHCCLLLNESSAALDGFRLALQINPDLDGVRRQIAHLERILKEDA